MTHHFFLVALHGLGLGGPDSLLVGTSGFPSAFRVVNLFCRCMPLGGAGAVHLVPEVISFHPSLSPEFC